MDIKPLSKRQIEKKLSRDKNFSRCYIKYADFRERDLSRANLYQADLEGADLEGVDLVRARCLGANFEGANLIDVCAAEAYCEDANFFRADCEGSDFRRADLKGANFRNANLARSCFERADCERMQAAGATMQQSSFCFSDCAAANFTNVSAERAQFNGAVLRDTIMKSGDFRHCAFMNADLSKADCEGADFRGAVFLGATLSGAILDGCRIEGALFPRGFFPELSARWLDMSEDGDGRDRCELPDGDMGRFLDDRFSLEISIHGVLTASKLGVISRFLSVMETVLPEFSVELDGVSSMIGRTTLRFRFGNSAEASVLSFLLFLLYQFSNGESIDCSPLETMIIETKGPFLSSLLTRKRPVSAEIVTQILTMKKVLLPESFFSFGRLVRFRYRGPQGANLVMRRDAASSSQGMTSLLVQETIDLLSLQGM